MNLSDIREKITTFLIPIIIVGMVLGVSVAVVGKTYFWDVSRLILQIPGSEATTVRIDIQARLVYFDADLFGFYYPVHITLPFSRTQSCINQCVFDRLPPGDATLTLLGEIPLHAQIFIAPDTTGTLDLRPAFELSMVIDPKLINVFRAPALTSAEKSQLRGSIEYTNILQGLVVLRYNRENFLYDTKTKQSMTIPILKIPTYVARGQKEGDYLFWTRDGMTVWNRYGQTPTQPLSQLVFHGYTFTWPKQQTLISHSDGNQTVPGIWVPIFYTKETLITDGIHVTQIQ